MAPEAQSIIKNNVINCNYSEQDAIYALHAELEKGIQSMRNGRMPLQILNKRKNIFLPLLNIGNMQKIFPKRLKKQSKN